MCVYIDLTYAVKAYVDVNLLNNELVLFQIAFKNPEGYYMYRNK